MSSLVDCRFDTLRTSGNVGSTSDMLRTWLVSEGANPADGNHISDLWRSMLASKGFTGHINDAWFDYLGSLGHTGSINDREKSFWCSGGSGLTQFAPNQTFTLIPLGNGDLDSALPDGQSGIASVTGTIADGQVLTISGAGFGDGPSNVVFENYENGALGSEILATNTIFDEDTTNTAKGIRDADSRSGSFANSAYNESATQWIISALRLDISTVADTTEVFSSYAVKVPTGSNFPGNDGGNTSTDADYSTDSSWKTDWLLGDNASSIDDDLVTLTHSGGGGWATAGNDLGVLVNYGINPTWWKWAKWNRIARWVKAGAVPNVDAGDLYVQVANTETPIFESVTTPVVFASGTAPYRFAVYQIPGWSRERATQGGVKMLYDDIYVAWGPNAAARIELGNASTYAACTDLAACDRTAWSNTDITLNCREGGLDLSQPTWLYVVKADNTTIYSKQVVF